MKKLLSLLRYVPKRFVPVLAIVAAAAIPAALLAWGPSRDTYTMAHPADHVTFDSITDNSEVGDERNFLTIKDASDTNPGGWQDSMTAVPGKEYLVRVYVHNDAASNLNLKAENTRLKVNVPTTTGTKVTLSGFISADNATPQQVWDEADLTSSSNFNVAYVPGSATLENNYFTKPGVQLSDNIVTSSGALLGYNALNGEIPGCMQYAGYVTFKVKVQGPSHNDFTFTKKVAKADTTDPYAKSVNVNPGDKVEYQLSYQNTGDNQQTNVVMKDQLPAGETLVPGTTKLYNANYPNGFKLSDNITTGINIGAYGAGSNAIVVFDAQTPAADKLQCGVNTLHNVAMADSDQVDQKQDSADVTTSKECQPQASYSCSSLNVTPISRTQFKFVATSKIENADFVKYTFVVTDANGKQVASVDNTSGTYEYDQSTVGKYNVQAYLTVNDNGKEVKVTSDNCKGTFEVTTPPVENKYACSTLTAAQTARDSFTFTVKPETQGNVTVKEYNFVFGDGQSLRVGADQATVAHTYKDAGDYTTIAYVSFSVDGKTASDQTSDGCKAKVTVQPLPPTECKPGIPMGDSRCQECQPGVPMGSAACTPSTPSTPTTPSAPSELPATGPEAVVGGLFGTSALGLGVHSWIASRRALKSAMRK